MAEAAATSRILTLVFTDLADSMALKTQRGDRSAGELIARHRAHTSQLAAQGVGRIIDWAGDGCFLTFESPSAAVLFALRLQHVHGQEPDLPGVRIGMHLGEVSERPGPEGDATRPRIEGLAVDLAARICALARAGQVLMSPAVADSAKQRLDGTSFARPVRWHSHGSYRVKGFDGSVEIREVGVEGEAPFVAPASASGTPLNLGAVQGNLPAQTSSFVGREAEVAELLVLTNAHRLVTLTGVGGVGKTRLALEVARQLARGFPDGAWLVELAPVSDPAAVPNTVAVSLGITPQGGRSIAQAIAEALSGRRLLIVLDNCEHVLDAAADFVETLLSRTDEVRIIATSREGLRVGAEYLWPSPSLDTRAGVDSSAVQLFVARAQAVSHGFTLTNPADADAVTQICSRLDGIALAIELAAARMVSMSAPDLLARLTDRFRLLSGSRRGLERHQTLRQAVQWSYDLLTDDEKTLLNRCTVFVGGFDLQAASSVCGGDDLDEYAVLDLLDSLVRKSLVTTEQIKSRTRYGLLETIRQFAEEQLVATGTIDAVRDRHAGYLAAQASAYWEIWDGPRQGEAIDWLDVEFADLRTGFRWAHTRGDLETAAAIAAHSAMLAWALERYEPAEWAEEILAAAAQAELRQLPRLYTAASICAFLGRPEKAIGYAQTAQRLENDPRHDGFAAQFSRLLEANGHLFTARTDLSLELYAGLAELPGSPRASGLVGMLFALSALGRLEEAVLIAEEALAAARSYGNPYWIAWSLWGYGQAFTKTDPARALNARRQGLTYSREHQLPFWEHLSAIDAASLETTHGEVDRGLALFDNTVEAFHRSGNLASLTQTFAALEKCFDSLGRFETAATIQGARRTIVGRASRYNAAGHLRDVLGAPRFDECVHAGAAMKLADAVQYARDQIRLAREQRAQHGSTMDRGGDRKP